MKVLITGGAGYIGTELAKRLNNNPNISEIIVYDNLWKNNYNLFLHSQIKHGKVRFVQGEILDTRKLTQLINEVDVVYHLAARVAARLVNASHHLYEQINHWGTAEVVYATENSNVSKFIYLSSIAVFGDSDTLITDDTLPQPKTFYGTSKLRGEDHVKLLMDKLDAYIIRMGNVYGYGTSMRIDSVVNKFMFDTIFSGKIKIYGNGHQKRGFLHIKKAIDVLENILFSDTKPGTYNATTHNYSILEIADQLKEIFLEVETLFVDQHLDLRNIEVAPNKEMTALIKNANGNFKDELLEMKELFYNSSEIAPSQFV